MALWETWVEVAEASSVAELQSIEPKISEVAPGTRGRVAVAGLPSVTAKIFDLALAEQVFGSFLAPKGAKVIDCHEKGGIGYVEFEVTGTPVHLILFAIAAALLALGILVATIIVSIKIAQIPAVMFSWQIWLLIALGIIAIVIVIVLVARKGRIRAGRVVIGK